MLVLTVKEGDSIWIGENIRVCVAELFRWRKGCPEVRLGIECPKEIPVHRTEVLLRIRREKEKAQQ